VFSSFQPTSSSRLVTLNLLISSSQAETNEEVRESSIYDLSTLINLVALYDELIVLNTVPARDTDGHASDLIGLLNDEQIVKTQVLSEQAREEVSERAKKHLAVFISKDNSPADNDPQLDTLIQKILPRKMSRYFDGYRYLPTEAYGRRLLGSDAHPTRDHSPMIDRWLAVLNNVDALMRETTREESNYQIFLFRAFLYLSYAHLLEIPFTPDAARASFVEYILKKEDTFFRTRILRSLQTNFEEFPPSSGHDDYRKMISPFAAVVFQRCNGSRSRLVTEIKKLRDEMKPTRQRLRELEWHAIWDSRTEGINAENKLRKVIDEIAQNFGPQPGFLRWETGISLTEGTGEIIDNPTSIKAWVEGLLHIPFEVATRLLYRRPVAEIHHLQKELPSSRALKKVLFELFGDLK